MQNDLISRSSLIEAFHEKASEIETLGIIPGYTIALNVIKEQPTAYNVEEIAEQVCNRFKEYLDDIVDNSKKLDKVDFLLKQKNEICNIIRNGGKE